MIHTAASPGTKQVNWAAERVHPHTKPRVALPAHLNLSRKAAVRYDRAFAGRQKCNSSIAIDSVHVPVSSRQRVGSITKVTSRKAMMF